MKGTSVGRVAGYVPSSCIFMSRRGGAFLRICSLRAFVSGAGSAFNSAANTLQHVSYISVAPMSTEKNKALVIRFEEASNQGNLAAFDEICFPIVGNLYL